MIRSSACPPWPPDQPGQRRRSTVPAVSYTTTGDTTLALLRNGKGNPSFKTLLTLAESFEVSVWSLLGIRDETVSSGAESYALSADEIDQLLSNEYSDARFGDDQTAQQTRGSVAQAEPPED